MHPYNTIKPPPLENNNRLSLKRYRQNEQSEINSRNQGQDKTIPTPPIQNAKKTNVQTVFLQPMKIGVKPMILPAIAIKMKPTLVSPNNNKMVLKDIDCHATLY